MVTNEIIIDIISNENWVKEVVAELVENKDKVKLGN